MKASMDRCGWRRCDGDEGWWTREEIAEVKRGEEIWSSVWMRKEERVERDQMYFQSLMLYRH